MTFVHIFIFIWLLVRRVFATQSILSDYITNQVHKCQLDTTKQNFLENQTAEFKNGNPLSHLPVHKETVKSTIPKPGYTIILLKP